MKIKIRTKVQGDYREVLSRFDRSLFEALTPPGASVKLLQFDGSHKNDRVHIQMKLLGFIKQDWISVISEEGETDEKAWFIDEGVKLPFFLKRWKHQHIVENHGTNSVIVDDIRFQSPLFFLDPLLWPVLYLQFRYRKPIYGRIFGLPQ